MAKALPETCEEIHPDLKQCWELPEGYDHASAQEACSTCWPGTHQTNKTKALRGPCPLIGYHYDCKLGPRFYGSVGCCPCCEDHDDGPEVHWFCKCTRPHGAAGGARRGGMFMKKNPFKNHPALLKKMDLELAEWFVLTTVASSPIPFEEVPQKTA